MIRWIYKLFGWSTYKIVKPPPSCEQLGHDVSYKVLEHTRVDRFNGQVTWYEKTCKTCGKASTNQASTYDYGFTMTHKNK
jgi:hypothetical protein